MDKYRLPKSVMIEDCEVPIDTDFRNILKIFEILNDPDLLTEERVLISLDWFYDSDDYCKDIELATKEMFSFICMDDIENQKPSNSKPVYDWEADFDIIVAPVNKILGTDVRGLEYLHWWTFLSAFMEIGESTFNTFVGIRTKLNKGVKLEKYEEKILKENRDKIILKPKVDSVTQQLMDEIMGV